MSATTDPTAPVAGARPNLRRARRILTVITLLWLLLYVAVGVRHSNRFYPVTGFSMFSGTSDGVQVELALIGVTAAEQQVTVDPEELGLTALQLRNYLGWNVIDPADAGDADAAADALGRVADAWSSRHDPDLQRLTLRWLEHRVDGSDRAPRDVATWQR